LLVKITNHIALEACTYRIETFLRAVLALTVLALSMPTAWATTFSTPLSVAEWQIHSSPFECQLSHQISHYGTATFAHKAGESEVFLLSQEKVRLPAGEAKISASEAGWDPEFSALPLGVATVDADKLPVRLETSLAFNMRTELQTGKRVVVTSAGEDDAMRVVLEPLRFHQANQGYVDCLKTLLPVSYAQVSRTTIYFDAGAGQWPATEAKKLDWLIQYVKADSEITQILIDGHTDSSGARPRNLEVSQLRSQQISTYLQDAGIDSEKMVVRWHGERYPVASNKSSDGRQKNRRVTLRLERDSPDI